MERAPLDIDLTQPGPHTVAPSKLADRCEVASVVLESLHAETSPIADARIERGVEPRHARLRWATPGAAERESNANELKAAEEGAEGVAFATVWRTDGYIVRRRAYHGSGADWILQKKDAPEAFVRLEVSGIMGGAHPGGRLREKVLELRQGTDRRPGIALVVAFSSAPVRILMEDVP